MAARDGKSCFSVNSADEHQHVCLRGNSPSELVHLSTDHYMKREEYDQETIAADSWVQRRMRLSPCANILASCCCEGYETPLGL